MAARLGWVIAVALVGCSAPMPSADARQTAAPMATTEARERAAPSSVARVQPWDEPGRSPELPAGLSRAEAIELARAAAPQSATFPATVALAGPGHNFGSFHEAPHHRWVWYILLSDLSVLGGTGTIVFLDYVDGRVYEVINLRG